MKMISAKPSINISKSSFLSSTFSSSTSGKNIEPTANASSALSSLNAGPAPPATRFCLPSLRNISLTLEDRNTIQSILAGPESNDILVHKFGIDMSVSKFQRLRPVTWLDDSLIDFYVSLMLLELQKSEIGRNERIHCFSTAFFAKLLEQNAFNYDLVHRWPKAAKAKIFELKKIFIPVHLPGHWVLVFIDMLKKAICYFCSLGGDGRHHTKSTLKVVTDCIYILRVKCLPNINLKLVVEL